ncbi:Multidrug resistance-associated protein 1-like protein [Aphelenchoides bicaudatus]|nr:Multidrug resistance-associated protein 1-like protein [Aphelenchoides bicaudatus]
MADGNWTNFTEFFENFCASDFWHNESYYNDSIFPNFTPCFQQTVLVGIPALFLFVIAPIFTFQLEWRAKRRDLLPLPQSLLLLTKCILTILLSISSLIIFLRYLISWDSVEGQAFVWSPLIRFQTSAYLTHMQKRLNRFGHTSSGFVFNVTFLLLICSVPEARSWIERIFEHNLARPFDLSTCILFIIWFVSLTIYFLLQFWADPSLKRRSFKCTTTNITFMLIC